MIIKRLCMSIKSMPAGSGHMLSILYDVRLSSFFGPLKVTLDCRIIDNDISLPNMVTFASRFVNGS